MKKIKCILSMILVCAMILPVSMLPVSAEDATTVDDGAYLYTEDFSCSVSELTKTGWNSLANYTIDTTAQKFKTINSGNYSFLKNDQALAWSNYTVEADVVVTREVIDGFSANGRWGGIVAAVTDCSKTGKSAGNGYEFMICYNNDDGSTYCALKDRTSKTSNSADVDYAFTLGTEYTLKMELKGNTITCYINDEPVITNHEIDITGDLTGSIGVHSQGHYCTFDNIRVYQTGSPWFEEDFSSTLTELGEKGWTNKATNEYAVVDNKLEGLANKYNFYGNETAKTWNQYTVEAEVTILESDLTGSASSRITSLLAAVTDTSSNATTAANRKVKGYEFQVIYTPKTGNWSYGLTDYANSTSSVKTATYSNLDFGTHTLKMVVNQNTISCYIDGDEVIKDHPITEYVTSGTLTGTIGVRASGVTPTFDNILVYPNTQVDKSYYDVSFYRAGRDSYVHPFKEGKVFAGWYADAEYTTALSSATATGKAYAKFVDANVLSVKAQLDATTLAASDTETTKMRFVTTVDNLDYQKVGFTVSTTKNSVTKTASFESTTAYKNIVAIDSNTAIDYEPRSFSNDSNYFVTIILKNLTITEADLTKVFTVTPYWVTADGTTVTGITRDADNEPITIDAGIRKNLGTQDSTQ